MRRIPAPAASSWREGFFSALGASDLSPLTKRTYRYDVAAFERWLQRIDRALKDLTVADLTSYRHALQGVCRLRPATINRRLHPVRSGRTSCQAPRADRVTVDAREPGVSYAERFAQSTSC